VLAGVEVHAASRAAEVTARAASAPTRRVELRGDTAGDSKRGAARVGRPY